MAKQTENNVGIYLRLSKEDMLEGESLSIENQKMILTKFVHDKGWNLVSEYVDDGYSGTDFDRPGIQRLLADAQLGKINIVVVKDLSRFGRNYIEVGRYIDYIFPMNNIPICSMSGTAVPQARRSRQYLKRVQKLASISAVVSLTDMIVVMIQIICLSSIPKPPLW